MKLIPLSNSRKKVMVNDEDYPWLIENAWKLDHHGYVIRCERIGKWRPVVFMHRVITNCPSGKEVDHLHHNLLDNRSQNSGFVRKWRAQISIRNWCRCLGYFWSEIEAAKAYNAMARKVAGKFALLNPV